MIWLYRILYIPFFLISFPYYLRRMLKRGGYGKDFHHRLGLIEKLPEKRKGITRIWIQAVSLGEIKAIKPLVQRLLEKNAIEIVITTTTSTAYKMAHELYGDKVVKVAGFPLDFWFTSRTAWKRINPDIAILMEAELWPEHIHQARIRKVPLLLINARLSDRSYKRYLKFKFIAQKLLLKELTLLLAGSQQDLDRFVAIGVNPQKLFLTGNIKFDVMPEILLSNLEKIELKKEMGFFNDQDNPLILMGSSTWSGEEILLIKVFQKLLNLGVNCRILLVPRHPERREEIKAFLETERLPWHFRSESKQARQGTYIYIGDTIGELSMLAQVANLAFIGKSLAPHDGGQTPIEAASIGLPLLYGPNMTNFKQICQSLETANAAVVCSNAQELEEKIIELLIHFEKREAMAIAVKAWHDRNKGATGKTLAHIEQFIMK